MKGFADLADLPEDDRIKIVAGVAAKATGLVGVVVDDDTVADRYIAKFGHYPEIRVVDRGPGPVTGTILIRLGQRGH